jgi:hypothetical protein
MSHIGVKLELEDVFGGNGYADDNQEQFGAHNLPARRISRPPCMQSNKSPPLLALNSLRKMSLSKHPRHCRAVGRGVRQLGL